MKNSINSAKEQRRPLKIAYLTLLHTQHPLVRPQLAAQPPHLVAAPQPHLKKRQPHQTVKPQLRPIQLISLIRPIIKIGVKHNNMYAKLLIELIKNTYYVQ